MNHQGLQPRLPLLRTSPESLAAAAQPLPQLGCRNLALQRCGSLHGLYEDSSMWQAAAGYIINYFFPVALVRLPGSPASAWLEYERHAAPSGS